MITVPMSFQRLTDESMARLIVSRYIRVRPAGILRREKSQFSAMTSARRIPSRSVPTVNKSINELKCKNSRVQILRSIDILTCYFQLRGIKIYSVLSKRIIKMKICIFNTKKSLFVITTKYERKKE